MATMILAELPAGGISRLKGDTSEMKKKEIEAGAH
jgi:hypothetical protein